MNDPVHRLMEKLRRRVMQLLPDRIAIARDYRKFHGKNLRLNPPITFNEKIAWRKMYDRDPRLPALTDKLLAKEYAARLLGSEWINPVLWQGSALPARHERNWPIPYVLKANHGSQWNYFVRTFEDQDWDAIELKANTWLRLQYGKSAREWGYSTIKPALFVEPYLGPVTELPLDYKLWVFGGSVAYIQVNSDSPAVFETYFYDRAWNRQSFDYMWPGAPRGIARPQSLEKMIGAAELLGAEFAFVRVDFFEIAGHPYFAEMSFYPNSGLGRFMPESADEEMGRLWKLDR